MKKFSSLLSVAVFAVAALNLSTCCFFFFHQPEVPSTIEVK